MKLSLQTVRALQHAEGYLALGMTREAGEVLREVAPSEEDALPVLAMRAAVLHELADWPKAAEVATRLCERSPEDAGHWIQRAYAVRRARSIEDAKKILLEAMARHPEESIIRFNLACYEAQLGRLAEARDFLAEACRLDPACAELAKTDPDLEPLRETGGRLG
jgi:Putative Zn-dependent protease, contains TPR repeats